MIFLIILGTIILLIFSIWLINIIKPYNKLAYWLIRIYADNIKQNKIDHKLTENEICENLINQALNETYHVNNKSRVLEAKLFIKYLKDNQKITDIKSVIYMVITGFAYWEYFGCFRPFFGDQKQLTDKAKLERIKLKMYIEKYYKKIINRDESKVSKIFRYLVGGLLSLVSKSTTKIRKIRYDLKKDFNGVMTGNFFLLRTKISGSFFLIGTILIIGSDLMSYIILNNGGSFVLSLLFAIISLYLYIIFIWNRLNTFGLGIGKKLILLLSVSILGAVINHYYEGFQLRRVLCYFLILQNSKNGLFYKKIKKTDN